MHTGKFFIDIFLISNLVSNNSIWWFFFNLYWICYFFNLIHFLCILILMVLYLWSFYSCILSFGGHSSWHWLHNSFYIICLTLWYRMTVCNYYFISCYAVVVLVMDLFVFTWILRFLIFMIKVSGTNSNCYSFVIDSMLHNCTE